MQAYVRAIGMLGLLLLLCTCTTQVVDAHCSACGVEPYTAAECARWGELARCQRAEFVPDAPSGCLNGCRFEECDLSPRCRKPAPPANEDAGDEADASD
jgi:hypothetical protein